MIQVPKFKLKFHNPRLEIEWEPDASANDVRGAPDDRGQLRSHSPPLDSISNEIESVQSKSIHLNLK